MAATICTLVRAELVAYREGAADHSKHRHLSKHDAERLVAGGSYRWVTHNGRREAVCLEGPGPRWKPLPPVVAFTVDDRPIRNWRDIRTWQLVE